MASDAYIQQLITRVIQKEGLYYVNHPNDRGGPTYAGITLSRLRSERGAHITAEDVKRLTESEVRKIYADAYFKRPRIGELPDSIVEFVFDGYVTSGTWAIKHLQQVLNDAGHQLRVDGVLGGLTLAAAEEAEKRMGADLLRALIVERTHFFFRIAAGRPDQNVFLRGWITKRAHDPFWKGAV